uniref:Uncharacterized protein n=1 Tax=Anopheles quadriannulatus TaxID=34691 RepID=A0A182WV28_ANOQN
MLGSTANGRLMGPGVGSSTSSSSSSSSLSAAAALQQQQSSHTSHPQHQLGHHPFAGLPAHHHHPLQPQHPALSSHHHHHHHHHRSIWPSLGAATGRTAYELQTATNGEERAPTDDDDDDDDDEDLTTSSMENHNRCDACSLADVVTKGRAKILSRLDDLLVAMHLVPEQSEKNVTCRL